MIKYRFLLRISLIIYLLTMLFGCSLSTVDNITSNGTLTFNQSAITVATGSTRELILTLANSTNVTGLNVTVSSTNSTVATVSPAACILSSEPGSPQSCEIIVTGLIDGSANIVATAPGYTATSVAATISSSANVTGTLSFNKSTEGVTIGSTNHVKLSLDDSSGVSNLVVNLASSNAGIAAPTVASCTLSSGTGHSCEVIINGVALGTATITASAAGYAATSIIISTTITPILGSITFNQTAVSIPQAGVTTVKLRLDDSSGVSNLQVNLASSNAALATVRPSFCTLSSGTTAVRQCTVTITGVATGSTTINATASGYSINPVNVTITQSFVPITQFGVQNNCPYTVWMQAVNPPVAGESVVEIASGQNHSYAINGQYVPSFRVWPKTGCPSGGQSCNTGQQLAPCPNNICQPPIDSLWEGTFNAPGNNNATSYDTSLVNGFTLPFVTIVYPAANENSPTCLNTDASQINLANCPTNDNLSTPSMTTNFGAYAFGPFDTYLDGTSPTPILRNLLSVNEQSTYPTTGQVQGCMAPQQVLTYTDANGFGGLNLGANSNTPPYSPSFISPVIMYSCAFTTQQLLNNSIAPNTIDPTQSTGFTNLSSFCNNTTGYCSPSDPNGPAANQICNLGPINQTQYVQYIHANTTNIYAQTYDDRNGNLQCNSAQTKIAFVLCP